MSMPPGPASKGRRRVSGQALGRTGGNGQAQPTPTPRPGLLGRHTQPTDIGKGCTDQTEDELGLVTIQRQSERQKTGKADVQSPSVRQVTFELSSTSSCAVAARESGPKRRSHTDKAFRWTFHVSSRIPKPRRLSLRLPNNAKRLFSVHRSIVLAPCHQRT
jgi:hypothetical protein